MDKRKLIDYRQEIRKGYTLTSNQYKEVMDAFFTQYFGHATSLKNLTPWLERGGIGPDRSTNLHLVVLFKSSSKRDMHISRLPLIYKLLTSLHFTPYQAANILTKYLEYAKLNVVLKVIHNDNAASLGSLRKYADTPEQTRASVTPNFTELVIRTYKNNA
jgi:hypothetical protein